MKWSKEDPIIRFVRQHLAWICLGIVVIASILGALFLPSGWRLFPRRPKTSELLMWLEGACEGYFVHYGKYPGTTMREITQNLLRSEQMTYDSGLKFICDKYLLTLQSGEKTLRDIWGREFIVKPARPCERVAIPFIIYSAGPNGVDERCQGDDVMSRARSDSPRERLTILSEEEN